jgi:hypothetical protein
MRGRLSTVDLLALTSLGQLILRLYLSYIYYILFIIYYILFTFATCYEQAALIRRSTVLSVPLQLVFPIRVYKK